MQLRDLLFILNEYNDIKILRVDCQDHEVYYGKVMDIPEYLYDYYLVKDSMGNPLSTDIDDTNYPYFTLIVSKNVSMF